MFGNDLGLRVDGYRTTAYVEQTGRCVSKPRGARCNWEYCVETVRHQDRAMAELRHLAFPPAPRLFTAAESKRNAKYIIGNGHASKDIKAAAS